MKLIITGELPLEHQEIDISDTARIELLLGSYEHITLRLRQNPATPDWHTLEVHTGMSDLLLQPDGRNRIGCLLKKRS